MIITAKANGDVLNIKPSVFYQGSTEANRIYLIAPFAINSSVSVGFTLPNTKNIPVTLMTPSTVISDTLNTWVYNVPATLTQYVGIVKVNISITTPSGNIITLNRCQFEVKRGDEIVLPEEPEADVYATIVQALAQINADYINKVDISYTENEISQSIINSSLGLKLIKTVGDVTVTFEVTENGVEIDGIDIKEQVLNAVATANEAKSIAESAESVALGIDAKATEALSNSETAVDTANEAKAIALSVEQAKVFDTFEDMETWLKDEANKGLHTTGLELLIKDANVPDYWVTAVLETPNANGYYYDIEESEASVLSVNGKKGVVVLKTDDISDTDQINKWSTAEEKEKVSKIDISGDGKKALLNDGAYGEVGTVDTVNNVLPDENKNITITADDISDSTTTNKFATAEELAQIATNTENIEDLEDEKVDIEYINELLNLKNFIIEIGGFADGATINLRLEEGSDKSTRIYWGDGSVEDITTWGLKTHTYNGLTSTKIIIKSLTNSGDNMPNLYSSVGSASIITGCRVPSITTTIGDYSFFVSRLRDIDIPHNITTIGAYAFYSSLVRRIELGRNITSIGNNAFKWCDDLEYVKVFALTPPTLGTDAFANDEYEYPIYVPKESLTAYKTATNWSTYADRIFPIPDGKWIIEDLAQIAINTGDITDLQDDKVDKEFSSDYAFTEGLVVTWKSDTSTYRVGDGTETYGNGYTGTATEIIIPKFFDDGVHGIAPINEIGIRAFRDCIYLTSITIPNSVTSIGDYAFRDCIYLTSITIPNSVTTIWESAFRACTRLTSITIPDSVTSIGAYAFYDCTSLTSITIPNSVTNIGVAAFRDCISLTEMTVLATTPPTLSGTTAISTETTAIYVPYSSLTAYKTATNWSTYADRIFPIPDGKWIKDSIDTNTNNINALETNKADKAITISGYGITDAYTKTEIESKIASVYKYKGSVANYASLPTTDLTIGDVYNVEDTGDNYAWTGTEWDKLAGTIDLSNYATKLSIGQWHVPYRDLEGTGEPNTSRLATMTSPLPQAILIRDAEGKATFTGGTSANQGIVKSQLDSAIASCATTQSYTATLISSGWTGTSAPYSKEVTVSGILATDNPDFDLDLSSVSYANIPTIQSAWFNVYRKVPSADKITFYSHEIPSIDIPLLIKVVR